MRKTKRFGLVLTFLLLMGSAPAWGAGSEPLCTADGCVIPRPNQTGEYNPVYNDVALFIGGISNPGGALAEGEGRAGWVRHARFFDQNWEKFTQGRLAPMRAWAAQEVASCKTTTVFYPFSGPDFINAFTLFPRATTYLMIALEPVGELPDFTGPNEQNFFASLQRSLYDLLYLDFFITNKMKASISKSELKGALPVILFFLAREKARVLDIRYWVMKPDGAIEESPGAEPRERTPGIPGVRIVFTSPGETSPQTLYYFQFNLANDSLGRNEPFVSFLKSFGPMTSFTKAASYLMFGGNFSGIRQFILDQSLYVLQGDSGIPLKHFAPELWNLKFYGTYDGPISLFKKCYQPDMANQYKHREDIQPLPFGIDYRHRVRTSNLLLASKKGKMLAEESK
jgi:hypothetical protein